MIETLSSAPAAVTAAAPTETFSQGASSFAPISFDSSIISPQEALSPTIDFSGGSFIENDTASVFSGIMLPTPVSEIGPLPTPYETIVFQEGPEIPTPSSLTSNISPLLPKIGIFTEPLDKSYELPFFNVAAKRSEEHMPDEVYEEIPPGELPSPQEAVAAALSLLGFSDTDDFSDMPPLFEGSEPAAQIEPNAIVEMADDLPVSETVVTEQEPQLHPEIEQAVKYVVANASYAKQTLMALKEINYPDPEMLVGKIITSQLEEGVEVEIQTDPQANGEEYVALEEQVSFILRNINKKDLDAIIVEWVRDEKALQERKNAFSNATSRAYRHNKEVNGSAILKYYDPTESQKSEPLQGRPREDNSLTETVREVKNIRSLQKKEKMLKKISNTTKEKPPVRLAVRGKSVTEEDVERVFKLPVLDLKALIKQIIG